jgi:hypothetical protein
VGVSSYPDDVRHRPARRIDARAVVIIYDFSVQPPQEIGLNSSDAVEWKLRDPKRYRDRLTSTGEEMEKQIGPQPQAITGTLVNWNTSGVVQACWLVYDLISNQTFVLPTVDAVEWISRDLRYSRAFL